jgi:hypothetical protein
VRFVSLPSLNDAVTAQRAILTNLGFQWQRKIR